jgi:hypothetical protein
MSKQTLKERRFTIRIKPESKYDIDVLASEEQEAYRKALAQWTSNVLFKQHPKMHIVEVKKS